MKRHPLPLAHSTTLNIPYAEAVDMMMMLLLQHHATNI
jgi:hypothetical protein